MNAFKKLLLGLVGSVFIFLLLVTAFDVGFARIATHPENVKKIVSESGLYSALIPSVLQQTKSIETSAGTISTTDTAIVNSANQALSPQYVQQNAESIIDSVYTWLDGGTAEPTFKIDLSVPKLKFADNVAAVVQQRLAALPACTAAESRLISQSGNFDAINATCLPAGTSADQAAAQVKDNLFNGKGFLEDPVITSDDVSKSHDDKTAATSQQPFFQRDQIKQLPDRYQQIKHTPLILAILTTLAGIGVVFLSANWQKGLRHVGIVLAVVGVLMLVFAWGINREVNKQLVPKIKVDNLLLQKDLRNLAADLTDQIHKNYMLFGVIYTAVGVGAIAGAEAMMRRSQPKPDAASVAVSGFGGNTKPRPKAKSKPSGKT